MIKKRNPFYNALLGFKWLATSQWNFIYHLTATVMVLFLGYLYAVTKTEWILLSLAISVVWMAELFNTALEFALDKINPDYDSEIGKSKDLAAAAVLTATLWAIITGAVIFYPKIQQHFMAIF